MSNTQSMTAGKIFDYVDRLEAENRALKEQHERMVDASEYSNTPISFAEAARILGIKTETLEGYVEQGLIKRMICEARVGKIDRHVSLCDILTIRGGKKALRRLSRAITTGAKHGRVE